MNSIPQSTPEQLIRRLEQSINHHDLEAMAACFAPDYKSEFPAHPERAFQGHAQMKRNWTQLFAAVPDLHANLLGCVGDAQATMAEWAWDGRRPDGAPFAMRGVTVQGIHNDRIVWTRLYMEPLQEGSAGMDAARALNFPERAVEPAEPSPASEQSNGEFA